MVLVVLVHVFGVKAVVPGKHGLGGGAVVLVGKVVFHMALGAHEAALLITRKLGPVLPATLQPVFERLGVGAQFHGHRIMAVGATDGFVLAVDLVHTTEFVDIFGPEGIAVLLDPFHHIGGFAVPAGGGQAALAVGGKAVDAVVVDKVLDGIGVATGFIVFVHKGITQPQVFEVGLGVFESLGQRVDVVVLVVDSVVKLSWPTMTCT